MRLLESRRVSYQKSAERIKQRSKEHYNQHKQEILEERKKKRNSIRAQLTLTNEEKAIRLQEQKRSYQQKSAEKLKQYRIENNILVNPRGRKPKTQTTDEDCSNHSDPTTAAAAAVVVKICRKPKNNTVSNNDDDGRSASLTPSTASTTASDESKIIIDLNNTNMNDENIQLIPKKLNLMLER